MMPIAAVVVDHPALDRGSMPTGLHVLVLSPDGPIPYAANTGLPEALPVCLLLVGWSERDRSLLERERDRTAATGTRPMPEIVILEGQPSWDAVELAAARATWPFLQAQSRLMTQVAGQSAALRIAHHQMQEHFRDLEDFMLARSVSMIEAGLVYEPESQLDASGKDSLWPIVQTLPIASRQLAAVALHVAVVDWQVEALLTAKLESPEMARELGHWRVPIAELGAGWFRLGLPATPGGLAKTVRLSIHITGDSGEFRLSAGRRQPITDHRFTCAGLPDRAGRSLALALFVAPPGIRLSHEGGTILPQHALPFGN